MEERHNTAEVSDQELDALLHRLAAPSVLHLPSTGQRVGQGERYHLGTQLGRGGQGVVYRALDLRLKRPVAIKFILRDQDDPEEAWQRRLQAFDEEINALARLRHEHILTIHDRDHWQELPFLVMEYLQGQTLRELIRQQGPLPQGRAVRLATQIARGLEATHAAEVIHRDLKPANVFILPGDRVRILDFGLSWRGAQAAQDPQRAQGGTALYMAPEQWRQQPQDARTDTWALGVLLYEMLTGCHPFGQDAQEAREAILHRAPHELNLALPAGPATYALRMLLTQALQPRPERRFQSACALREALEALQLDLDTRDLVELRQAHAPSPAPRRRALLWMALAPPLLALLALWWSATWYSDPQQYQRALLTHRASAAAPLHSLCLRSPWLGQGCLLAGPVRAQGKETWRLRLLMGP